MSPVMATLLKLLFLCALAHSSNSLAVPDNNAQRYQQPPTISSTVAEKVVKPSPPYLLVRGDSTFAPSDDAHSALDTTDSAERHNFDAAAQILLAMYNEQISGTESVEGMEQCNDPSHKAAFSGYDYTILLSMLIISLGIGVFYGFFHKSGSSSEDFLLGSGMSIFPVTLSLTTSFITAIELLGNPSEMYLQGTQFVLIVIPMIMVIPVAVKIFYPIYFKMELTSCYEYLGIRFGKEIRILGAVLYVIQMCFYTAVAVLAPAIALSKATGLNTKVAVILIYLVCVFYSSQGGMKAVVIADTFQAVVLAVSLVLVIALGSYYSGNAIEIFNTAADRHRLEFFNFDFDPTTRHTVWSVVIGGFFYWTSLFCTNQASVQKCMSLKSLKLAKVALGFAILGLVIVFLMNFYTGLMIFNHYADCDPLNAGRITASDQLLPYYIISTYEHIYTIAGIFVAGIFAASLGTVASALNSLSAVTCEDLLVNGMNIKITPDKGALYAKWMSLGYGILSFGLVFIVEKLGGVLQATLTLNGLIGGVTLGLFVLGIAFKRANTRGAFYGGLLSLAIVIFIGVMAQIVNVDPVELPLSVAHCDCQVNATSVLLPTTVEAVPLTGFSSWPIFKLSYMWYSMIGTLLTIFLGLLISLIVAAVQRHNVLKISSTREEHVCSKPETPPQFSTEIKVIAKSEPTAVEKPEGHVNLAIRLDDE
ncbi:sodium-coupled monocarboxylate transporter 1 [Bactrocera dorsalis]|uniref:Sodium-coupled monocarboxylate transporter 1 n=1 Tax=Bactrocera dorsalis TaxID=27457 RepID=A0A6I9UVC1_BACDO|nr:sodium-coupled monocarboxylate transporter 1 [Bactrocera dorsalis]